MKWGTVDFIKFPKLISHEFLRKFRYTILLNCVFEPLDKLSALTKYKMQHTSQVIYLEKMLNEFFSVPGYDPKNHQETKTVYIEDGPRISRKYIYQPEENKPVYLGTVYLSNGSSGINYKFIVNIPESYSFNEMQLRSKIDYYKLAGKKYIIRTY